MGQYFTLERGENQSIAGSQFWQQPFHFSTYIVFFNTFMSHQLLVSSLREIQQFSPNRVSLQPFGWWIDCCTSKEKNQLLQILVFCLWRLLSSPLIVSKTPLTFTLLGMKNVTSCSCDVFMCKIMSWVVFIDMHGLTCNDLTKLLLWHRAHRCVYSMRIAKLMMNSSYPSGNGFKDFLFCGPRVLRSLARSWVLAEPQPTQAYLSLLHLYI